MISVNNLTFDYPGKRALTEVAFKIEANTITALVGPNGAGKTTLLHCIAALDLPYTGQIEVNGLDVLENPRKAHTFMGYLPDFYGLYNELSVRQCLMYHAMVQNIAKEERNDRINDIATQLGIEHQLNQLSGTLSRGQRQRLGIAQAIIHRPKVLLLDEPATGLDPESRIHLSELLVNLKKQGTTIIVSSHILTELEDYSTHMLILREGRIVKHCAISESESKKRLLLQLSQPSEDVLSFLETKADISDIKKENETTFSFYFSGDVAARSALLKELLNKDFSVIALSEIHEDMNAIYMSSTK